MPKSTYLDDGVINAALRDVPFSSPAAVCIALFTTAPGVAGGGVEVTGGSYARQPVTWSAPDNGSTSNDADIVFPLASADWGILVAWGIFDALSSGNLLYFGNLGAARTVQISDQVRVPIGQLVISES